MDELIQQLLNSDEACIRYKTRVNVLGEDPDSARNNALRTQIKESTRVNTLLSQDPAAGPPSSHPYAKWYGAHWILAKLAEIGYPAGDDRLIPWREQVLSWLLPKRTVRNAPTINGRVRRCASQEGNAVYYLLALGLADERVDLLVSHLLEWQWPDGGWNCDKNPSADNSSFHETWLPLRGLVAYAKRSADRDVSIAIERAAEIFLKRKLFRRQRDGQVIHPDFLLFHYPAYWHYDLLTGLKVMAEAVFIQDPRCSEALDMLEGKQLPTGGWAAEAKYYHFTDKVTSGRELVDWGSTGKTRRNEFVSVEALCVLKAAGRLTV
jgi:hypothetical protein